MDHLEASAPYTYILDDAFRVVMAGPSNDEDPLTELYDAVSASDALPTPIDHAVRALTASWKSPDAASAVKVAFRGMHLTVAPLHGVDGYRIAVFIHRSLGAVA